MRQRRFIFDQAWCFFKWLWVGIAFGLMGTNAYAEVPRIVTLDASITEIVFALDKSDWVVGRDSTSQFPKAAQKLPDVGYIRTLNTDAILALNPTLVLTTSDAEPKAVLTKLQAAGIEVVMVDNHFSLRGLQNKIMMVANRLKAPDAGQKLVDRVQKQVKDVQAKTERFRQLDKTPSAFFVLRNKESKWLVAGAKSRADELMKMVGIYNPLAQVMRGYEPLTPEVIVEHQPQLLITLPATLQEAGGKKRFAHSPLIGLTTAGKKERIIVLKEGDLSFGPRLGEALQRLAAGLMQYPELFEEGKHADKES